MASNIDPNIPADGQPVRKSELRSNFDAAANEITALQNGKLDSGSDLDLANNDLDNANIESFTETLSPLTAAAGVLTVDLTSGTVFTHTLSANITSISVINLPSPMTNKAQTFSLRFVQNATGGYTVTWPASFLWSNGGADKPVVTPQANAVDIFSFTTYDGGATWSSFVGGQNFG